LSAYQTPGYYAIDWQALDLNGRPLGTGIYLARIQSGDFTDVIRMVYLK